MLYLASYRGTGTEDDPFRPDVEGPWSAIDLTPPRAEPTKGRCLVSCEEQTAKLGRRKLSESFDERLSATLRGVLGNQLGITVEDVPTIRRLLAHLLIDHGDDARVGRWNKLRPARRGFEIWLGERVWEMPAIRGGATITDDFNVADNAVLSGDLTWSEVLGAWSTEGNLANLAASTASRARAQHDLNSDDHYAQTVWSGTANADNVAGVAVRYAAAADTCYRSYYRADGTSNSGVTKEVAGSTTILHSVPSTGALAVGDVLYLESDGSTLISKRNGVTLVNVTDTSITGNLRCGLFGNAGGANRVKLDNFEAGDLGGGATDLVIQDASHGHSTDGVALSQQHALTVQDVSHAHSVDALALSQLHILAVADSVHAHTAEASALTQAHVLSIQEALHGHAVDNLTLSVLGDLVIADAFHAHLAEAPGLTQAHVLSIQEALHAHIADNLDLTQLHILTIQDASHGHEAEQIVLVVGVGDQSGDVSVTISRLASVGVTVAKRDQVSVEVTS